ncbi:Malectin/receptor-like protein kinase family protein [Prunus dulcis]|uniref:Malectin/receptor-like protein kinase family protein n=1 Tax=Prunus dulcis TaxID=3755 RepID=A0A5H2XGE8_PRUDU|nr:Malectin/receptor-like protein kinase family protein [Prunus dulcis]
MTNFNDAILNGLEIFKLSDTSRNLAGPNPDPPPLTPPKMSPKISKKSSTSLIAIVAGVVSGLLVLVSVLGIFLAVRRGGKVKDSSSSKEQRGVHFLFRRSTEHMDRLICVVTLHWLRSKPPLETSMTVFIIGVGGFGNVYKGCIDDGATLVAIKRLKSESSQGAHEFKTEIELLSQFRHRHLVSLIGYCKDGNEMVLVYDYMSRGTLASHLYHTDNPPLLGISVSKFVSALQ